MLLVPHRVLGAFDICWLPFEGLRAEVRVFLLQIICCCAAVKARKRFLMRNTYDYILYDYICTSKHLHLTLVFGLQTRVGVY